MIGGDRFKKRTFLDVSKPNEARRFLHEWRQGGKPITAIKTLDGRVVGLVDLTDDEACSIANGLVDLLQEESIKNPRIKVIQA